MPPATAAPPREDGPSPPDSAVAPHHLGFPPHLAGTPLSGKPRQGSQPVPDTKDDPRTPGSADFFLREPSDSSDDDTDLPHTGITYQQQLQWRAQIKKPPAEHTMVHAFGGPAESQKHAWRELWCAAVDRWENKTSLVPGYDTPPSSSSSHLGSCSSEQGSKDTTAEKSAISEQGDAGEKEAQALVVGSVSIQAPKNTTKHTEMLEQKNGDEDHLAINCAEQVDQLISDDGSNLKKNAVCGSQTFLESHCSSPKNNPGNKITDIQESFHSPSKSGLNSPRYIQESSSSRICSCTSEQGSKDTTMGKSTSAEQGDTSEKETQGLVVGSARIHLPKNTTKHTDILEQKNDDEDHLAINCAEQVDKLLPDDGSNLKKNITDNSKDQLLPDGDENTVCGGQTFLESHCSSPMENPGKNITDIQESCHRRSKSGPNSPRDFQESSSCRIGSCIAEQNTSVGKIFISEQHISDGGEAVSQGPYFGSDRNHLAESTIDKIDQVNLENNTVCGGKQSLLDSCFKCGKHGQLLKCRSCPIAAHVSCFGPFGSSVTFDDGHFYCPACFFYKANEALKKAKKGLSETSKHLSDFLLLKPFAKQHRKKSTENEQLSREDEELGHERTNDARDAFPERNYDTRTPARTRSPRTPRNRLAPRRRSFVTTARHKPINWTEEEEAALREAVARFGPKGKGKISWVRIWEHSMHMFHPARLPKHLGQKWNRMKRREARLPKAAGLSS